MKKNIIILVYTVTLFFLIISCGRQDSPSCSGKIYNSPSIYVAGTYVYTSIYAKNKSADPNDASCPTNTDAYDLVFGKSTDSGNTWSAVTVKQKISPSADPINLSSQAIAADDTNSNRIYISYIDSNNILYCASSADGGSTWTFSRVENTTNTTVADHAIETDSAGGVHIVYTAINSGLATLKAAKSTDFGATWTLKDVDTASNTGYKPSITIDSSNLLYVSYYYSDTNGGLKFARSIDLGSTWSPVVVKTGDGTVSGPFSSVAVTSSAIYVAFYNPGGYTVISGGYTENKNGTIQIMKSTNGGSSFSSLVNIDTNSYSGKNLSLVSDGSNNLYVSYGLYQDEGVITDNELKFASSTNGGATFTIRSGSIATGLAPTENRSGLNYLSNAMTYYNLNGIKRLYLIYVASSASNAVFQTSTDGGTTWGAKNLAL